MGNIWFSCSIVEIIGSLIFSCIIIYENYTDEKLKTVFDFVYREK